MELVQRLGADKQIFSNLLLSIGGKLEPHKCNYKVLYWKFDGTGKPYVDCTVQALLHIEFCDGTFIIFGINYLLSNHLSKYLGLHKDCTENQDL